MISEKMKEMVRERLFLLYKTGEIKDLSIYVKQGWITPEQAEEIKASK